MALVFRNARPYYHRSVRRDGRVTSEYRGSGKLALLIHEMDGMSRDARAWERLEETDERDAREAAEQPLDEYFDLVEQIVREALLAAGYHQHKREWRKRRVRRQ
jgi:hypothetical protein